VGLVWDPVQPNPFLRDHLDRDPAGHPVHPVVHLGHELLARLLELGEQSVLVAQVRVSGDQVGLGDFHRRFHRALAGRLTG
jgi:hypothetical protein